jgi:hypothetical protein
MRLVRIGNIKDDNSCVQNCGLKDEEERTVLDRIDWTDMATDLYLPRIYR